MIPAKRSALLVAALAAIAGASFSRPTVTNVHVADLDQDSLVGVPYGKASSNSGRWSRQAPRGVFTETTIGESILGPAHVWAGDANGDGRQDVLVASMGQIMPTNDRIGAVIAPE